MSTLTPAPDCVLTIFFRPALDTPPRVIECHTYRQANGTLFVHKDAFSEPLIFSLCNVARLDAEQTVDAFNQPIRN